MTEASVPRENYNGKSVQDRVMFVISVISVGDSGKRHDA
jgi:hypothetical protein